MREILRPYAWMYQFGFVWRGICVGVNKQNQQQLGRRGSKQYRTLEQSANKVRFTARKRLRVAKNLRIPYTLQLSSLQYGKLTDISEPQVPPNQRKDQ